MSRIGEIANRYEALPGGEGRNVAAALHATDSLASQLGIGRLPFEYGSQFVGRNLAEDVKAQAERYVDRDFHRAMGLSYWEFKDKAQAFVEALGLKWGLYDNFPIPTIAITGLNLDTHYKLAGISTPTSYRSREAYVPEGGYGNTDMELVWMNDGGQNLDRSVTEVKEGLGADEDLATAAHGVGLLIARPELLAFHRVYLPGSLSRDEDKNKDYETVAMLASGNVDGSNPYFSWQTLRELSLVRDSHDLTKNPKTGSATIKKTPRVITE